MYQTHKRLTKSELCKKERRFLRNRIVDRWSLMCPRVEVRLMSCGSRDFVVASLFDAVSCEIDTISEPPCSPQLVYCIQGVLRAF